MSKPFAPSEVDFWLEADQYEDYVEKVDPLNYTNPQLTFNIDLIRLASVRKAISNFVRIMTRKNIPVYFNHEGVNRNVNHKVIYISASIRSKWQFDVAVGQALHEGAHGLLTDFDVVADMWANLPTHILQASDAKNIRRSTIERFIHRMWNVVEDRYIDNYVFVNAPGYRGYYVALYDCFWHDTRIDYYLKSDEYRWPSLESYLFRISNLTNIHTDLTALPRLEDIADVIDLSNIDRLKTTRDRIETAFQITEIVLDCLDTEPPSSNGMGQEQQILTPDDVFGPYEPDDDSGGASGQQDGGDKQEPSEDPQEASEEPQDAGEKLIKEITDVMSGRDPTPTIFKENYDAASRIDKDETEDLLKQHEELAHKQGRFLTGNIKKDPVTPEQKELLELIEQHGITIVGVGEGLMVGDHTSLKVDCIVVKKMTKDLIFRGKSIFPLSTVEKVLSDQDPEPPEENVAAVNKGIQIGTKLGQKLLIRMEENKVRNLRKRSGKINKRQLHEAAFEAEDFFYKEILELHNKAVLHISVDASGSMHGEKWLRTMTSVVAICKAASMIDNIHVTVSFRSTQAQHREALPYVIMAYDSRVDKFLKVKHLFPYLEANGFTPEGLAFEATMYLFEGITPDEEDRFFLNLSDGEPYYHLHRHELGTHINYQQDVGVAHTRHQVNKIRRKGVEILSYFIEDGPTEMQFKSKVMQQIMAGENLPRLKENFHKMYGKHAKFINVESIVDLARTMNELFLSKQNQKNS